MVRRRAAASADQPYSRGHELARVTRHVLGRTQIDIAAFDRSRHAGIGLGGQRQGSESPHPLDYIQHGHRADAAIAADHVGTPAFNAWRETLRSRTVKTISVFVDGDVGDHWDLGIYVASGQNRLVKLFDVAEGFQHQQVDATLDQSRNLLPESGTRFLEGGLTQRFNANPSGLPNLPPIRRSSWRLPWPAEPLPG